MMRKRIHYTEKELDEDAVVTRYAVRTIGYIALAVMAVTLIIQWAVPAGLGEGVASFLRFSLVTTQDFFYQAYWMLSALIALYGFLCLGWFRQLTRITTVLLFIAMMEAVAGTGSIGFIRNIHDAIHQFLIPFYEAGFIIFTLLFHIVYPLCVLVAHALAVFFSLPVIGWVFSAVCWIVDHTLTSLPSFDTILDVMSRLDAEGSFSGLAGRVMYAMDGGSWGAYLKILPDYVSSFFDDFTYFLIMFAFVGVFYKVTLFFTCYIWHGLDKYFTSDNEDDERLSKDPDVMEVLHRSRRHHPFKMPVMVSIRYTEELRNALTTSRKSIYIDPDFKESDHGKGILAHELGHMVNGDALESRIKYTFYISVFVSVLGTIINALSTMLSNPLFFVLGCLIAGLALTSISLTLSVANVVAAGLFLFSGKWQEFRADMYAVVLGYGEDLLEFFGGEDPSYRDIMRMDTERTFKQTFTDPHPSEKIRCLYLKTAVVVLAHIPFTSYWRRAREKKLYGEVGEFEKY